MSTGDSPFYLLYGREPRLTPYVSLLPPTALSASVEEHRKRIVTQIKTAQSLARNNIARVQQLMKLQYDMKAADAPFVIGQHVWVYTPKPKKGLSKKLRHCWHGPFRVCRQLSPVHYQLRTFDKRLVATNVHSNRMKHFSYPADRPIRPPSEDDPNDLSLLESDLPADSFEPDDTCTTPVLLIDDTPDRDEPSNSNAVTPSDSTLGDDVYAAERILKSRRRQGKLQYLVKWANYPVSQSTWEPEENLLDKRLLEEILCNNK